MASVAPLLSPHSNFRRQKCKTSDFVGDRAIQLGCFNHFLIRKFTQVCRNQTFKGKNSLKFSTKPCLYFGYKMVYYRHKHSASVEFFYIFGWRVVPFRLPPTNSGGCDSCAQFFGNQQTVLKNAAKFKNSICSNIFEGFQNL
ncbi:hypothetical protein JTE90_028741 [Oedothorax gibbosus]|uniref:Uncharacterized protein n=1 Tax=Oedothorax gibbosus TaxID=931172 RepID=A0AAV6UGM4_9ARAC|nr:hypothetical protein JTE90_028741 [Oedothorax gibbosus]